MSDQSPIFIHGMTPRSGTSYLSELLCVHPDCKAPLPLLEDYLLHHLHQLVAYVNSVSGSWQPRRGIDRGHEDQLWRCLGNGWINFLAARAGVGHGRSGG